MPKISYACVEECVIRFLEVNDAYDHLISYPQFTYDFFHMHHSFTYLSREHMNPKLTCSQRQWPHSSVGRASHRYREVTGSSPVEVLNFFQASLRNCKNCDRNCEDHSSFEFLGVLGISRSWENKGCPPTPPSLPHCYPTAGCMERRLSS